MANSGPTLEADFDKAISAYCDSIIFREKSAYQSQIQSFDAYAAKLRYEISGALHAYCDSFRKGYQLVLDQVASAKPAEEREQYTIPGKNIKSADDFFDLLDQKEVLQAVFDYTGEMMGQVYSLGMRLRQDKRQEESSQVFVFLITLNPYVCSFWQGLGKAWHELQRFDDALNAYSISISCDPYRIGCYRDAVRCCLDEKNYEDALSILSQGSEAAVAFDDAESLKDFNRDIEAMKAYVESIKKGK